MKWQQQWRGGGCSSSVVAAVQVGVSENRDTLFWGLYKKDAIIIQGAINIRVPYFLETPKQEQKHRRRRNADRFFAVSGMGFQLSALSNVLKHSGLLLVEITSGCMLGVLNP